MRSLNTGPEPLGKLASIPGAVLTTPVVVRATRLPVPRNYILSKSFGAAGAASETTIWGVGGSTVSRTSAGSLRSVSATLSAAGRVSTEIVGNGRLWCGT